MSEITFNWRGLDSKKDLNIVVNEIKLPIGATITENTQDIPGLYGNLFQGNSYGSKSIDIDITILADSEEERIQIIHQLTDVFTTQGDEEYPMIFGFDSAYTYYGHFTNLPAPERLSAGDSSASATITFVCSDPRAYGEQKEIQLTENPYTITPDGTSDCFPIFTCIPHKDTTKIAIVDQAGNYVYLGGDVDPDTGTTPVDNEPEILHDACNTLATWTAVTTPTFNVENGVISGSMRSTSDTIKVGQTSDGYADFGAAHADKWHGPCRMQWLSTSCQDYRIRVRFYNNQYYPRAYGKCELYLLDANGKRIGKVMLKDNSNSYEVYAQAQIGDTDDYHDIYYGKGKVNVKGKRSVSIEDETNPKGKTKTEQKWKTITRTEDLSTDAYSDFYGYIEIQKIGNKYRVEIMPFDDDSNPIQSKATVINWTDSSGKYNKALAGIAFYTAKYDITEDTVTPVKHYTNNGMGLCDVKVWNILNGGNVAGANLPVIARNGDEIKINCEDNTVYKNGAIFMDKLSIGSEFIPLKGGVPTVLSFEPSLDDADWFITYRPTRG